MVKFFPSSAKFRPDCCFWLTRDKKPHRRGRGGVMMSEEGGKLHRRSPPTRATTSSSQKPPGVDIVSARSSGKTSLFSHRPTRERVRCVDQKRERNPDRRELTVRTEQESIFIEPPTECLDRLNCLGSYKSLSANCVRSQSHPLCVISWGAGRYLSPATLNERIPLIWSEQMRFWALVGQKGNTVVPSELSGFDWLRCSVYLNQTLTLVGFTPIDYLLNHQVWVRRMLMVYKLRPRDTRRTVGCQSLLERLVSVCGSCCYSMAGSVGTSQLFSVAFWLIQRVELVSEQIGERNHSDWLFDHWKIKGRPPEPVAVVSMILPTKCISI